MHEEGLIRTSHVFIKNYVKSKLASLELDRLPELSTLSLQ